MVTLYFKDLFSLLTSCLLACILLAYWLFISIYKSPDHISVTPRYIYIYIQYEEFICKNIYVYLDLQLYILIYIEIFWFVNIYIYIYIYIYSYLYSVLQILLQLFPVCPFIVCV